jgi:HK97 family phage major capsid protein
MAVKTPIPTTPDELQEFLSEPEKVSEAFADPKTAKEFIESYRREANKRDPDLQAQAEEEKRKGIERFLEENGYHKVNGRVPMDPSAAKGGDKKALREEVIGFLKGVAYAYMPQRFNGPDFREAYDKLAAEQKDLSEAVGGDGGFLVPEVFQAELLRLAIESAVVRPRARVIPMASSSIKFPAIRDTSHASNIFGGVSGTWVAEAASVSSATNQPNFTQVRLVANKLTGYTVASNELLADSAISLEGLIQELFGTALAYFEDDSFINGTGAGQPLGILNADALITVSKETGQAATTIVKENIDKMFSRMLPSSLNRAVWVAHNDTIPQLLALSQAVGTGGSPLFVNNMQSSPTFALYGRPVVFSEKCQTLGTAGDIYFVDFSYYLIGDRQAMTMAVSPHVNFTTDEMTWRFTQRVDGRPWVQSALTPRNGSNTVSPYVNLATRA